MPSASLSMQKAMKHYPRLTRASILISIALFADQFKWHTESGFSSTFNLFGLMKPVSASAEEIAEIVLPASEFIEEASSIPLRALEEVEVVIVEEAKKTTDATAEEKDEDKLPDDLRELTVYPEPLMTDE